MNELDSLETAKQIAYLSEELALASDGTRRKYDRLCDRMKHLPLRVKVRRQILRALLSEQFQSEEYDRIMSSPHSNGNRKTSNTVRSETAIS